MKSVKLGLLAVALFGAIAAFAGKANSLTSCSTPSDRFVEGCLENNEDLCCIEIVNQQPVEHDGDYDDPTN